LWQQERQLSPLHHHILANSHTLHHIAFIVVILASFTFIVLQIMDATLLEVPALSFPEIHSKIHSRLTIEQGQKIMSL
jgi:hypothetical protein